MMTHHDTIYLAGKLIGVLIFAGIAWWRSSTFRKR